MQRADVGQIGCRRSPDQVLRSQELSNFFLLLRLAAMLVAGQPGSSPACLADHEAMSPRGDGAFASIRILHARCGIWLACCVTCIQVHSAFFRRDLPDTWLRWHHVGSYQKRVS